MSSNAFGAIEREQLRRDALRDQEKTEREAARAAPLFSADPRQLAANLRSRINPAYANQIGTESYERRLCAEAIERLLQQRDELLRALEGVLPFLTGEYWAGTVSDSAVDFAVATARKVAAIANIKDKI